MLTCGAFFLQVLTAAAPSILRLRRSSSRIRWLGCASCDDGRRLGVGLRCGKVAGGWKGVCLAAGLRGVIEVRYLLDVEVWFAAARISIVRSYID